MAAQTITPVRIANAPQAMADLTAGPQVAGEEWLVSVRVVNKSAAQVAYTLYLTTAADNAQAAGAYRAFEYPVDPKDAVDVERELATPSGFKLRHMATA